MLLRHKLFAAYMVALTLATIVNDVSAVLDPSKNLYVASAHQTSILLVFFAAFLGGTAAMYDIQDRERSLSLGRGTFVYSAIMWCAINSFWATGYFLMISAVDGVGLQNAFAGFDLPFSFGFYTPKVPRLVMVIYNIMNILSIYAIWTRKAIKVALAGIFLPILFVNLYAMFLGEVILFP